MKIRDGFFMRRIAGASIAVPVSGEARALGCIVNLNDSGALLFSLLQVGATLEDMARTLAERYDVGADDAKNAAALFVRQLSDAHVLAE